MLLNIWAKGAIGHFFRVLIYYCTVFVKKNLLLSSFVSIGSKHKLLLLSSVSKTSLYLCATKLKL